MEVIRFDKKAKCMGYAFLPAERLGRYGIGATVIIGQAFNGPVSSAQRVTLNGPFYRHPELTSCRFTVSRLLRALSRGSTLPGRSPIQAFNALFADLQSEGDSEFQCPKTVQWNGTDLKTSLILSYSLFGEKVFTVDGGRRTGDGGRQTGDGGRQARDVGRRTVDKGRRTDGRWTRELGRWTRKVGRRTLDKGRRTDGHQTVDKGRRTDGVFGCLDKVDFSEYRNQVFYRTRITSSVNGMEREER
ncbi:unnamed protein product [Nesidiocoris tenuis]|uniref:Uncharacterized protein n=1 Tax=Nesidiocoris tenuis TaxID=355587 RepID=A0A6H5FY88_9HEMI|nr:unnamed protein product [Nesidiocoris tenuis]